jgi:ankyrin repeat protein
MPLPPLHEAAYAGDLEACTSLIENRADINQKLLVNGYTPLHCAAANGQEECLQILLDANSDVTAEFSGRLGADNYGLEKTALHLAIFNRRANCIFPLLLAGADPDQVKTTEDISSMRPFSRSSGRWDRGVTVDDVKHEIDQAGVMVLTAHAIPAEPDGCVAVSVTKISGAEACVVHIESSKSLAELRAAIAQKLGQTRFHLIDADGCMLKKDWLTSAMKTATR